MAETNLLQNAMEAGSKPICEILRKRGTERSLPGSTGRALVGPARSGNTDFIKFFIKQGIEVNQVIENRVTPLIAAASGDNDKIVRLLIEQGAGVNLQAQRGPFVSALVAAATEGINTVKLLIKNGADLNMSLKASFGSPLVAAAAFRAVDTLKLLFENGADPNLRLERGSGSTLEQATSESKEPERGHIGYECSGSALIEAIRSNNYKIVKCLIEIRTDVNLIVGSSRLYCSALQAAVAGYELYIVEMPIEFGLDRNQLDILELLIENGANVNPPFETGRCGSALAAAALKGRKETVETFLDAGAVATRT